MARLVGLDLGAPRVVAVALDGDVLETLLDGAHGTYACWDDLSPRDVEALATGALSGVRARASGDARCRAGVVLPEHLDGVRRDALLGAVVSAGFDVALSLTCAEAVVLAGTAGLAESDDPGVIAVMHGGRGHLELGLFERYGGATAMYGSRSVRVARGDALAESLTSWLALTYGRRHAGVRLDAPEVAGKVVAALTRAFEGARPDEAVTVALPFLQREGEVPELRVEPEVVGFAIGELVERFASMFDGLLATTSIEPKRVTHLVASGGQLQFDVVARRLAERRGWICDVLGPTAAAVGGALAAAGPRAPSQHPPSLTRVQTRPAPAVLSRPAAPYAATRGEVTVVPEPITPEPIVTPPMRAAPPPPVRSSVPPPARSSAPPPARSSVPPPPARSSVPPPPAQPAAASVAPNSPSEAPGASLHRHGTFVAVRDAAGLLAQPIAHAASAEQLARPLSLPGLLAQIGMRPAFEGTLVLQHEHDAVRIGLIRGSPLTSVIERPRMLRTFEWPGGTYELLPELPSGRSSFTHEPMTSFLVSGLRPMLRDLSEEVLLAAFGDRRSLAPSLRAGRESRLARMGLNAADERAATHALDPAVSLSALILNGGMTRGATLRLVFLLELLDMLQWATPATHATVAPRDELARRVARMSVQNHFEVLGIHWSVNAHEVAEAWKQFAQDYSANGPWHRVDAALAREALNRGDAARKVLSDDAARLRHRAEAYPTMDPQMVAPLVAGRAQHLAMSKQGEAADDMLRLLRELGGSLPPPKR